MFTQHIGIDATRRDLSPLRQNTPQPRGIEKRARSNDLAAWQSAVLLGKVGKHVDGIGHEQQDGILAERLHVGDCRFQNRFVAPDEIGSALALFLLGARCDDDDVALSCFLVRPRSYTRSGVSMEGCV